LDSVALIVDLPESLGPASLKLNLILNIEATFSSSIQGNLLTV
jgi:hypothetical protein